MNLCLLRGYQGLVPGRIFSLSGVAMAHIRNNPAHHQGTQ